MGLYVVSVMGGDGGTHETDDWTTHAEVGVWNPYAEEEWLPQLYTYRDRNKPFIMGVTNLFWNTQPEWDAEVTRQQSWTLRTGVPNDQIFDDEFVHRMGHVHRVCVRDGIWHLVHGLETGPDEPFGRAHYRTPEVLAQDIRTANKHLATIAPNVPRLVCHMVPEFVALNGQPGYTSIDLTTLGYTVPAFDLYSDSPGDVRKVLKALIARYPGHRIMLVADGQVYATDTKQSKLARIEMFARIALETPEVIGIRIYRWARSSGAVESVGALCDTPWLQDAWADVGMIARRNLGI